MKLGDDMDNQKLVNHIACAVLFTVALGWRAFAQQPIYKAPAPADWSALSKLPDFRACGNAVAVVVAAAATLPRAERRRALEPGAGADHPLRRNTKP